jgi:hypothetical protein
MFATGSTAQTGIMHSYWSALSAHRVFVYVNITVAMFVKNMIWYHVVLSIRVIYLILTNLLGKYNIQTRLFGTISINMFVQKENNHGRKISISQNPGDGTQTRNHLLNPLHTNDTAPAPTLFGMVLDRSTGHSGPL